MTSIRKIIHIDMDCYYAQVEMRDNPALQDVPIAVGGDSERGVLCTCNYIARGFGVRSAMSSRKAKQLCPDLIILPGRMELYKSISKQIRAIFAEYTELVEPLSLDEAYLDVTDCQLFAGSATLIAEDIRAKIYQRTGLTASAGVSINKFIAKVASDVNKPNGICVVTPERVCEFVEALPVKAVPGVGKVMQKKLADLDIQYCRDLLPWSVKELEHKFGKMGLSLYNRIRGIDHREVCNEREAKTVSVETTFVKDIGLSELTLDAVNHLLPRLEKRLERESKAIKKLQVKLKFSDFVVKSKEVQLHYLEPELFLTMLQELAQQRPRMAIRLIGIGVGFGKSNLQQLNLFELSN